MANVKLEIQISHAWWFEPYLQGVLFVALMTGCEPDMQKVCDMMVRSLRWRFADARRWQRF